MSLDQGDPLFDEGEPAQNVFNVTGGCIKVYKLLPDGRRQIIGFLFPGDFLGLAITDEYAYSAEAVSASSVCRLPRRELDVLLDRFPKLEKQLLNVASNELAIAQDQMLLLGRKTAKEKVASMLLMVSKRARDRGQTENPIYMPMTRSDIGDYLGLTTETVSRTFTQLKGDGLIAIERGNRIALIDVEAMEEIAEGY